MIPTHDQNTYQDSRLTNIESELGIKFGIENKAKRIDAHGAEINSLEARLTNLEQRIKTLEEARQVQINLNSRFLKLEEFISKKEAEKPIIHIEKSSPKKSFWDKIRA